MDTLSKDVRYGFRSLLKRPAFTVIAGNSLALGIGANTANFSTINALLLKPLPLFPIQIALSGRAGVSNLMLARAADADLRIQSQISMLKSQSDI